MYFIDTNVFLEWFLGRKNSKDCEALFEKIIKYNIFCACSRFSVHSVLVYITGNKKTDKAKKILQFMVSAQEIYVSTLPLSDYLEVLKTMEETKLDFEDAMQYYTAMQLGCTAIITFDKDFKKTKIVSMTPKQLLEKIETGENSTEND